MTELKYRVPQQDVLVMKEVHRVLTLLESSLGEKAKLVREHFQSSSSPSSPSPLSGVDYHMTIRNR